MMVSEIEAIVYFYDFGPELGQGQSNKYGYKLWPRSTQVQHTLRVIP